MLPTELINAFWEKVCQCLVEDHKVTRQEALKIIADFHRHISHQVGDTIYNLDPEEVAESFAGAIEQGGFEELTPMPLTKTQPRAICMTMLIGPSPKLNMEPGTPQHG